MHDSGTLPPASLKPLTVLSALSSNTICAHHHQGYPAAVTRTQNALFIQAIDERRFCAALDVAVDLDCSMTTSLSHLSHSSSQKL